MKHCCLVQSTLSGPPLARCILQVHVLLQKANHIWGMRFSNGLGHVMCMASRKSQNESTTGKIQMLFSPSQDAAGEENEMESASNLQQVTWVMLIHLIEGNMSTRNLQKAVRETVSGAPCQ